MEPGFHQLPSVEIREDKGTFKYSRNLSASSSGNSELLPGGERCRLQVVASSGIRTAVAQTPPFAVAVKPVRAHILSPTNGMIIEEGERLDLRGIGFSPDFGTTDFEDMVWNSHRDGLLDVGYETVVSNLSPGRHRLELTVLDGFGGESIARVTVEVRAKT